MVKNLAVILARGGSKRIPRKNIIDFMGKPMLAWTVEAALKSNLFAHVIVSTDDEEIAQIARQGGAEVPFLRQENTDDMAPSSSATMCCLLQSEAHFNETYDNIFQLMPNCPIRDEHDLFAAYGQFEKSGAAFQISCFPFGWMNPWWALKPVGAHRYEYLFPEALKMRSQDLEKLYCPTGAVWIAKTAAFKAQQTFYGDDLTFFPLDWKSAVDIDDYEDLEMAQAAFLVKHKKVGASL